MIRWVGLFALVACAPEPAPTALIETACNGHDALCDLPLDQVTFPGTHNSMSNFDAGWSLANQQHGLSRQLEDGIRAMMLDTHEWEGGQWLCHGYCELGAQPLDEGLTELADFLGAHPRELLMIIFEDGITVEETVAALDRTGLSDLTWTWEPDAPLPTLGELVDANTRLILGAEQQGPPPDWYHHAWDLFYDTPYSFEDASEFSCDLNRGDPANSLFLVNHWLSVPLPTQEGAAEVNTAEILGARAAECEAQWGRRINFLGVDFYEQGDLFEVADGLNGL